jgi:uncharacterized alpha-E superfamily protein
MLSRVAETIYWIGRYVERAENTARLVSANTTLTLDLPPGIAPGWGPMVSLLGCKQAYFERHAEITERRVAHFLIADREHPGSILSSLALARENARTIREVLPREGWELLNELYHEIADALRPSLPRRGRHAFLEGVIHGIQNLTGLLSGTMNRNLAYMFLKLGRKLERADMTTRILDIRWDGDLSKEAGELRIFQDVPWMTILETLGADQMYRQTMRVRVSRPKVLDFVFKHVEFPRSLAYCMENIHFHLGRLPNNQAALAQVDHLERAITGVAAEDMNEEALHHFVDRLQILLGRLHAAIAETYFLPPVVEPPESQRQAAYDESTRRWRSDSPSLSGRGSG